VVDGFRVVKDTRVMKYAWEETFFDSFWEIMVASMTNAGLCSNESHQIMSTFELTL
jgi:hypothetical protein